MIKDCLAGAAVAAIVFSHGLARPALAAVPASQQNPAVTKVVAAVEAIKANKPAASPRKRAPKRKDFAFSESELNAYLAHWIAEEARTKRNKEFSVRSASIKLHDAQLVEIEAVARVDLGALKELGEGVAFVESIKSHLSMDNRLHLQAVMSAREGKATIKIRKVKVKGIPLPASLVQRILGIIGRRQRPPMDFTKPFDLPNGIETVEVFPGALRLRLSNDPVLEFSVDSRKNPRQ